MERLLAISLTEAEKAYIREKARDGVCKSQNGHECPLGRRNIHTELERQTTKVSFLVACTRLYKSLCRSVGWSVGRSVGRSVGWSVGRSFLGYLQVGKCIFEYLVSYKQHSRLCVGQ